MVVGRPLYKVNWDEVDKLLTEGNSGRQIAGKFGIHQNTLYEHTLKEKGLSFTEYSDQFYAKGETLLKSKQFDVAMDGNVTMLIWLGKQRLDQRERLEKDLLPPNDNKIDNENQVMIEKHQMRQRIKELEDKLDNLSKARPELLGSESPI